MFVAAQVSGPSAVKQVQQLLNLIDPQHAVVVDGVMGPKTSAAYQKLSPEGKATVVALVNARNKEVLPQLLNATRRTPEGKWVDIATLVATIKQVVAQYGGFNDPVGAPNANEYLAWLLDLEPNRTVIDGKVYYDANSVNGPYVGLYQIGPDAYTDVARMGIIKDLPAFGVAARDPWLATALALLYGKKLIQYLRAGSKNPFVPPYKGVITKEVLYSAHNQGAVGLLQGAKNALVQRKQSAKATAVIAKAWEQISA